MKTARPHSPLLPGLLLLAAVIQVAAPAVPALGPGAMPNESTTPLLITPAGYTFAIWGLVYALSIALALVLLVRALRTGEGLGLPHSSRLLTDLLIAFLGAAAWIGFSAAEWNWITSAVLTLMAAALIDASRLAAGPPTGVPVWLLALLRITVGMYAGWATAAAAQNWASDLGADAADPNAPGWQITLLVAGALIGIAVTALYGARLPLYPLTLLWALSGIVVAAWGRSGSVIAVCFAAMVAVVLAFVFALVQRSRLRTRVR